MTDKEKLEVALLALKRIGENCNPLTTKDSLKDCAAKVYAELTAPVMETGEVKRWVVIYDGSEAFTSRNREDCENWYRDIKTADKFEIVELTGTYQRPIPEPEDEVIVGAAKESLGKGYCIITGIPLEWDGEDCEVRLKKGE